MNVFKFINSRDIREHLQKINYEFSSLEAAWLVWQSEFTTIKEKHAAWREIIDTMPDCSIEPRLNTVYHPSLHGFLRELMELQEKKIQEMQQEDEQAVWTYTASFQGESTTSECDVFFRSFSKCREHAIKLCKSAYSSSKYKDIENFFECCEIRIRKSWPDNDRWHLKLKFNGLGEVLSIVEYSDLSPHEIDLAIYGLYGMWFSFPTPFKKGDICIMKSNFIQCVPFVFDEMCTETIYADNLSKNGDNTDMLVWGYLQCEDCDAIYSECHHGYMNLEFYRGPLDGRKRILKALSNYLKGEIDISLYSSAYAAIIAQEHAKKLIPCNITDEGMILAGLKEDTHE